MIKTAPLHVAADGVFVTSELKDGMRKAIVTIRVRLRNDSDLNRRCRVIAVIVAPGRQKTTRVEEALTYKVAIISVAEISINFIVGFRPSRLSIPSQPAPSVPVVFMPKIRKRGM